MEEYLKKSLLVIKNLNIESEEEYNKLLNDYFLLCSDSLKYILQTGDFKNVVELAKKI